MDDESFIIGVPGDHTTSYHTLRAGIDRDALVPAQQELEASLGRPLKPMPQMRAEREAVAA